MIVQKEEKTLLAGKEKSAGEYVKRFGLTTRLMHWFLAIPLIVLLLSGLGLLSQYRHLEILGQPKFFREVHLIAAIFFIYGPVLAVTLGNLPQIRAELREMLRFDADDRRWFFALATWLWQRVTRRPTKPLLVGKYNAGQKINTLIVIIMWLAWIGTGLIMWSRAVFTQDDRDLAFAVHDALFYIIIPILAGHLFLSLIYPPTRESLRGIITGSVKASWAMVHHPKWFAKITGKTSPDDAG